MGYFLDIHKELLQNVWDMASDMASLDNHFTLRAKRQLVTKIVNHRARITALKEELLQLEKQELKNKKR